MGVGRTDTMEGTSEEYSDSEEYDGESSSYSTLCVYELLWGALTTNLK